MATGSEDQLQEFKRDLIKTIRDEIREEIYECTRRLPNCPLHQDIARTNQKVRKLKRKVDFYKRRLSSNRMSVSSEDGLLVPDEDKKDAMLFQLDDALVKELKRHRERIECLHEEARTEFHRLGSISGDIHKHVEQLLEQSRERKRANIPEGELDQLPDIVLGACIKIEKLITTSSRDVVLQFCRALLDHPTWLLEDYTDLQPHVIFWKAISLWKRTKRKGTTLDDLGRACREIRINLEEVTPMTEDQKQRIDCHYAFLAENLIVAPVVIYLRDTGRLPQGLFEYILEPTPRLDQIARLVGCLPLFGNEGFDIFIQVLRDSGQEHIADVLQSDFEDFEQANDTICQFDDRDQSLLAESTDFSGLPNPYICIICILFVYAIFLALAPAAS